MTSDSVMNAIEEWERKIREYEVRFGKLFDEEVKRGTIIHLAPEAVQTHLYLNEAKYSSYADVRRAIVEYVEAHRSVRTDDGGNGPSAIDTGPLEKRVCVMEQGGRDKGKDKKDNGKGEKIDGYCGKCGGCGEPIAHMLAAHAGCAHVGRAHVGRVHVGRGDGRRDP